MYVVYQWMEGARGARFMLDAAPGWMHLGDSWVTPYFSGISTQGVTLCWTECTDSHMYLGSITFLGSAAPPCTFLSIVPDPATVTGQIEGLDCDWNLVFPTGGTAIVNSDGSCFCHAGPEVAAEDDATTSKTKNEMAKAAPTHFCAPLPVQQSTWGMIKSLYR
jgi:hypothetical protein